MEVQIDWDQVFDFDLPFSDVPTPPPPNRQSPPLSVDDIEQLLFKDDDDQVPTGEEKSGEVVDSTEDQKHKEGKDDDKKRKRQLRNKDAALRSRERKKMHVKDLEMKSNYFEGECRRLGSLLQWYMAENQALRFSLNSNASMTKQESAVLLLESLLLGSLLWLMGFLLLLVQTQSQLVTVVEERRLPSLPLRKLGGSRTTLSVGKRFKASRSRMRRFLQVVSLVF